MGILNYAKKISSSYSSNNINNMDFLGLGSGLLSGLGSIFGGSIAAKAQRETNEMNYRIATETNKANRENQEYQNEWNLNMWNQQNDYNDPSQQRKRLENAGLNPLFYGLDGTGNAGALTSADFVATPGAPMGNDGIFLGDGISNAMKSMAEVNLLNSQAKKTDAETQGLSISNQIADATKEQVIENSVLSVRINKQILKKTRAERLKLGQELDNLTEELEVIKANGKYIKAQTDHIATQERLDRDKYYQEEDKRLFSQFVEFENLILDKRRVNMDELINCEMVEYLSAMSEHERHDTYEKLVSFFSRSRNLKLEGDKTSSDIDVNDSSIRLNDANAKYIGKKGDYYEYELLINGLKTVVLTATLLK